MNTKVNLKESNIWAIHDAFKLNQDNRITGVKLQALYKLIQSKGDKIDLAKDTQFINVNKSELQGVKVLEYDEGQYIGMIHTPINNNNFFPCKLKKITLTKL